MHFLHMTAWRQGCRIALGLSKQTVLRTIEPFLVRHGWVSITPRGRTLTVEAEARAAA